MTQEHQDENAEESPFEDEDQMGLDVGGGVFECRFPKCGKRFTTKFSLKRHYYIHSRKKTFPC